MAQDAVQLDFIFRSSSTINKRWQAVENAGNQLRWGYLTIAGTTLLVGAWLIYHWLFQPPWLNILSPLLLDTLRIIEAASVFTLAFVWSAVIWRQYRHTHPRIMPILSLEDIYALSPGAFERYVGGLFRQKGFTVKIRGRTGDLGVDLEVRDEWGKKAVVQCKRYQKTVGAEVVRELYGTMIHERAARGFLITTAPISPAAREWAQNKPLTLIDGDTLVEIATVIRDTHLV